MTDPRPTEEEPEEPDGEAADDEVPLDVPKVADQEPGLPPPWD